MGSTNNITKPTPIFIVGLNRSGTTWLCNILCNHPEIAGVRHELHYGIVESNMLGVLQTRYQIATQYEELINFWARTDYFKIAGGDKDYFLNLAPRPADMLTLFEILMDSFALKNEKPFWLQKVQPGFAIETLSYFRSAKVVVIHRDIMDVLKSGITLNRAAGIDGPLAETIYSHALQLDVVKKLSARPGVHSLHFENLTKNTAAETKIICAALGIDYFPEMLNISYKKNTSFKTDGERNSAISDPELKKIKLLMNAAGRIPIPLLRSAARLKNALSPNADRAIPIIPGSLRLEENERNSDDHKTTNWD